MEDTTRTPQGNTTLRSTDHKRPVVFVLDGDSIARSRIDALAQAMNFQCEQFVSGHDFLAAYDPSRPGCLVTEVRIPELGGLEVQRRLAMECAPLPVVFLSAYATVPVIVRAMRMGAVSFLEKPPNEHDLWEAIQEAMQEDEQRREAIARNRARQEWIDSLEPQEQLMLEHIGQGTTMRDVAKYLGISVRTAEIRRNKLMQKLNTETYVELLRYAFAMLDGESGSNGEDTGNGAWPGSSSLFSRAKNLAAL